MAEDEWLTVTQAAALSGFHPEHVRELLRAGEIPGKKFGPVWAVSQSGILDYVEAIMKLEDKRYGPKRGKSHPSLP